MSMYVCVCMGMCMHECVCVCMCYHSAAVTNNINIIGILELRSR